MAHFLYKVLKSFTYAGKGIASGFQERNMQVHGFLTVLVLFLGLFFRISLLEWILVIVMIGLVLAAELINTAIEEVCNCMRDELGLPYKSSQRARDVAAGAVLILAIVAAIVGLIIFFPRMWMFLRVVMYY